MSEIKSLIAWGWAKYVQNRENIVSLATLLAGLIGIPLLAIRTFAANRSANASLEQAKGANQSAAAALKQVEKTAGENGSRPARGTN